MNAQLNYQFDQFQRLPPTFLQGAYASELSGNSPHIPYSPDMIPHSAREQPQRMSQTSSDQQQSQHSSYPSDHMHTTSGDDLRRQEIYARLAAEQRRRQSESIIHGGSQSVQTAAFGTQDQQLSHDNRKEMVQRMLNERKLNRSGQASQYSQRDEQEEQNNVGGYNPEALYQDDIIEDYSQRNTSNENRGQYSRQSHHHSSDSQNMIQQRASYQEIVSHQYTDQDDTKYRDAVAYARAEIERERKQKMQQMYQENTRRSNALVLDQSSARHSVSGGSRERSVESAQGNNSHNGSTSGQKLSQIERYLHQNSQEKLHIQMNNNQRQHNFTYDSEGDSAPSGVAPLRVKKLSRNKKASAPDERGFRSTGPSKTVGEYMKATVNADLKRDNQQATIAKTKHLVSETEKKFKEQHTFKPQINEYPLPASKEVSKEERWKKLTEPKTALLQQRERIRAQIEVEETQKNCTFKPQLNQTINTGYISNRSGNTTLGYNSVDVAERLLHEADLRKEKREKLKRELELQQMKDCSFKPKILSATTSSKSQSTLAVVNLDKFQVREPIHTRVGELQKEKNEKLQKLRIDAEKEQQESYTFQPAVNKKSAKIAIVKQSTENNQSVVDRLYRDANDRIEKQMSHNVSTNEQMNREYSFHPQISKTSAYLSAQNENFSGNMKDFHARQEEFIRRQHEKRAEAKKKWGDEERYSYKPEINATSEVIVESDPLRGQENEQERLERLYKRDQKKQEVVREIVEREVYGQYTFKPEINKVSKAIARSSASIDELAYNPKGRERKEQLQEQMMTQEFSDCTFRPQTTKTRKYQNVTSSYSMQDCNTTEDYSRKLKEKLKQKQERIAQERREREYQLLKDCTFKPQILEHDSSTIGSSNNESVASVKGIQRHLELKELKKKQEEEKRLREAEVFGLNHKFAVRSDDLDLSRLPASKLPQSNFVQHQTIPEPFELTKGAEHRKQMLAREVKEREMQECTFKPKTNEGRNKQIIQQLMRQENLVTSENPLDSRASLHQYANRADSNDEKENHYNYPQQMNSHLSNYY